MAEDVILVDNNDNEIGTMPKMEAHISGVLHRAFSVFIFNTKGDLLLQQRALHKYHSGGKWTNTCCSHPRSGEENIAAANRRLLEEMGMSCDLIYGFNFLYKAHVENGLIEHEFDHVYYGITDDLPIINLTEVADYKYLNLYDLANDLKENPDHYTEWLKIAIDKVLTLYKTIF